MTVRAEIRGDLIKRLFAVAISVGAANTVAKMKWITDTRLPHLDEWEQIAVLVVALTATVLSWDGYLVAITNRPLDGFWRFAIDILLVFIYMVLLITSGNLTWWLPIHALTFLLYVVWDILTIKEHTSEYYKKSAPTKPSVANVYVKGLLDSDDVSRGPVITVYFMIYFIGLYIVSNKCLSSHIFVTSAFALAGLILYRQDKIWGLRTLTRTFLILLILLLALACARLGPWDKEFVYLFEKWI